MSSPPRARVLVGIALAVLVHGGVLLALRPAAAYPSAAEQISAQRAAARAQRAALLGTAEGDVAAGRVTLGDTLIRLGWFDRFEEEVTADSADRDRALAAYRAMLTDVRAAVARGEPAERAIVDAVEKDGRAGRYKRM